MQDYSAYEYPTPGDSFVEFAGSSAWRDLLFIRDGIEKEILEAGDPFTAPDQVRRDGDTFELPPGDVFGWERVTLLYNE